MFTRATFFTAAHDLGGLPPDVSREVAFVGRSNAGKSSAINALTHRRQLAFVSKTPGRTQAINLFALGERCFLVDLPGYGYAAVPRHAQRLWGELISAYIQNRGSLRGLILIVDARHALTELDRQLLDWFAPTGKPVHVLLTKADKLGRQSAQTALRAAQSAAAAYPGCTVQLFSSVTRSGVGAAQKKIAGWLK